MRTPQDTKTAYRYERKP